MKNIKFPLGLTAVVVLSLLFATSAEAAPSLSQTYLTIGLGQTATVTSQVSGGNVYVAANSSPSVASIQVSGTQITVLGQQLGSTIATICYAGTASDCANLNVTVQSGSTSTSTGSNTGSTSVSFSQNDFTMGVGQSTTITVSGGNGTYKVQGNSSPTTVSTSLNGSSLTLSALASGNANISICDTSNYCSVLYISVTVSAIGFSNSNPSLSVGQSLPITLSGGSGYYVTGSSNYNIATYSISNNILTLTGSAAGSTNMTICSSGNGCGYLTVTVSGTASTTQVITLSLTNPILTVGQSLAIGLSGGSNYFVSVNSAPNVLQVTVNGSSLNLYGASAGSATLTICGSSGGCSNLNATVNNPSATVTNTATTATTNTAVSSQSALLSAIQSMQTQLAQILTQIQSMANTLTNLTASLTTTTITPPTTSLPTTGGAYVFTGSLNVGMSGPEVTALQQKLTSLGFYKDAITGYYGFLTEAAVKAFQSAHGITPVGYVGPSTRAILNGQ